LHNCSVCGKFTNRKCCEEKVFLEKGLVFNYHSEAARYFNVDSRYAKRKLYNVNYTLNEIKITKNSKLVNCKICNQSSITSKCRAGYCKNCSRKGLGKKTRGIELRNKYLGEKNPNFKDGKAKQSIRSRHEWKEIRKEILSERQCCEVSGHSKYLHLHHILPVCLFPQYSLEKWNIIVLQANLHIEVHRQDLDIVLLPNLCSLYKEDVHLIREEFVRQLKFHKFHLLDEMPNEKLELLKENQNWYRKKLHLIPIEFVLQEFGHLEWISKFLLPRSRGTN
jgi:hypothetical protein